MVCSSTSSGGPRNEWRKTVPGCGRHRLHAIDNMAPTEFAEPCLAICNPLQPTVHHNSHYGRSIFRAWSSWLPPAGTIDCRHRARRRRYLVSTGDEASGLFRREPGQPAWLFTGYRIRRTILRFPRVSSAITATSLHWTSANHSPPRAVVARGSLALLIRDRISRLNVHFELAKWMAVRTPPKRPRRNPTARLLPRRDSTPKHSTIDLCNSDNQRCPSHTRRHGQHPDPALLVSPDGLVPDRGLTRDSAGSNLACS